MEGSTVSPPPASPTEGDDLCEIDVSSVAIHSVTLLVCLCGLAGNGAVLRLISLEFSTIAFRYLAVADFLFLVFALLSSLLLLVEDVSCSTLVPLTYLSFFFQLPLVSCCWGLFWLADTSVADGISILCRLCCRCSLPERLRSVMVSAEWWAFFTPFTVLPTVTFLCPAHEQEKCRAAVIPINSVIVLLFAAPTIISRTIRFIKAKRGSQQQQLKRREVVIFFVVLFTLLLFLWNFLQQLIYTTVSSQVVFLLFCINSSIKPFIYFSVGRCWRPFSMETLRKSLQRVFEEQKKNTAREMTPLRTQQSEAVDPFLCPAEGPRDSG